MVHGCEAARNHDSRVTKQPIKIRKEKLFKSASAVVDEACRGAERVYAQN
jgi:hypothetical protein